MIISIWVFFMLGDSLTQEEHRTAYVQIEAPAYMHDVRPEIIETECAEEFHLRYPGYVVCDSGWCKQQVQVWG